MNVFKRILQFGKRMKSADPSAPDNASPSCENAAPAAEAMEKHGPELNRWYTFGAHMYRSANENVEVIFTNERKSITRTIVDNNGAILSFPGVDNANVRGVNPRCLEPIVRFRTDFERQPDDSILMLWQVQPDGRYWEDEDGFGSTNDEEILLFTTIDTDGCFTGPFRLYRSGATRFHSWDLSQGIQAAKRGNMEEAFEYFLQAAKNGICTAQFNAALLLLQGEGTQQNPEAAVNWFRKAADAGLPEAMENLGVCLMNGIGCSPNLQRALNYFRMAAAHGMPQSMYNLGVCHEQGQCLEKDYDKALQWYHKASEAGFPTADLAIGAAHAEGRGVPADYSEAVKWYEKAARAGVAKAQFNLGSCFSLGLGVEQNHETAVFWYRKAVEQDYPDAQFNLAACYANGQGVPQDFEEALRLLTLAAQQNHKNAQMQLSMFYQRGIGVPQDMNKAREWLEKAQKNQE